MSNPTPPYSLNSAVSLPGVRQVQIVSDTKWSTKTIALGVAPATTDFFTSAPSADPTVDNYDAGNQLVTSQKSFTIQAITVALFGGATTAGGIIDLNQIIEQGVIILTAQNKEIGRFRVRNLSAAGGLFVAGAQVAAAAVSGLVNGNPQASPWQIAPLTLAPNQSFKATLAMPTVAPVTLSAAVNVQIGLVGFETRPAA